MSTYVISEELAGIMVVTWLTAAAAAWGWGYFAGRHVERKERETK